MMRALCLVLGFALLAAQAPAQTLRMSVRPTAFSFAPADVEIKLRAEPGGRQREIVLVVDGPKYFRSSLIHVDHRRDEPSVIRPMWYADLPAGEYVITATLTDCAPAGCATREQLLRVSHRIRVLGPGDVSPELEP